MRAKSLKSEFVNASASDGNFSGVSDKYYRKFFKRMAAMFTKPGLISLDEEDLAPFKSFVGHVYMGEAEAVGENAASIAAKEALSTANSKVSKEFIESMTKKFTKSPNVLVHILGSADKVDMSTANEAVSVIREITPNAEVIFAVHLDEKLGDALRVTVFVKLYYDIEHFYEYASKLYNVLRGTPREKLPGVDNCPEYQKLYDSAQEDDDGCWFDETIDAISYDLSGAEDHRGRFAPLTDMDEMPELILEEILTGNRPAQT